MKMVMVMLTTAATPEMKTIFHNMRNKVVMMMMILMMMMRMTMMMLMVMVMVMVMMTMTMTMMMMMMMMIIIIIMIFPVDVRPEKASTDGWLLTLNAVDTHQGLVRAKVGCRGLRV